jgi:hypothetical protein
MFELPQVFFGFFLPNYLGPPFHRMMVVVR